MAPYRIRPEWIARFLVLFLALGLPLLLVFSGRINRTKVVNVHAKIPETGGWLPAELSVGVGEPLDLRLVSDDVVHSFAVGKTSLQPVDLIPGKVAEISLTFDEPGTYTFYCTKWCGPNHWRMRGTIEVTGSQVSPVVPEPPPYMSLGIDLDLPHDVQLELDREPSAQDGAALDVDIPEEYLTRDFYLSNSPFDAWLELKDLPQTSHLSESEIWDIVAWLWASNTNNDALDTGEKLYAQNCAACHGETGNGSGVFARSAEDDSHAGSSSLEFRHEIVAPTDFTNPSHILGSSSVLLQGKILRGGMGTGMPSWGQIFTEDQIWAIVDFLWTYQFQMEDNK